MFPNYADLTEQILAYEPTGSRVICSPPVETSDIDFVVRVKDLDDTDTILNDNGWDFNGSDVQSETGEKIKFWSFSKDNYNLICTEDREFYNRFCRATRLAKRFNLLNKEDRIALFQAILYQNG